MGSLFGGGSKNVTPHQIDKSKFEIKGGEALKNNINTARNQANSRADQSNAATQGLITDLTKQSRGEGPSLATAQLKQAQDRTLAQQLAAVQAARPQNAALSGRQALRAGMAAQQQNAQQGAQLRMQEQLNAQQQLGQVAGQQNSLQGQLAQQYMGQDLGFTQAQAQLQAQAEGIQNQNNVGAQQLSEANKQANADRFMNVAGSLMSGAASGAAALSDKTAKKNIKKASKDMDGFLSALSASKYKYKDETQEGAFKGDNYGVMAQDLEKSEVGKTLVDTTPNGKMVDTKKGFGAVLAAQSRLHERLAGLEKSLGKKKEKKNG